MTSHDWELNPDSGYLDELEGRYRRLHEMSDLEIAQHETHDLASWREQYYAPTYRGTLDDYLSQPLWSEIVEGLWQGGTADDDINIQKKKPAINPMNFDAVVTLYQPANPADWFVKEYRFGMMDSRIEDVNLFDLFDAVKFAHDQWMRGGKVLIRCQAGWNRSGLVMALVLIRAGWSAQAAIDLIREKRHSALCNQKFASWLIQEDPENWRGAELIGYDTTYEEVTEETLPLEMDDAEYKALMEETPIFSDKDAD